MPPLHHVGLVYNPAAAGGRNQQARLAGVVKQLRSAGCTVRVEAIPGSGEGAKTTVRMAAEVETVLAVGGDGTFREVIDGVMLTPEPRPRLGVLAFGTGNDAAALLGLKSDAGVVAAVVEGGVRPLDVLEVRMQLNGMTVVRHALLFAAVGFSSDLVRATTPNIKRWFGAKLGYGFGFFRALIRYRPVRLRVRTGRGEVDEVLAVALAANAPLAGGGTMRIAPGASLSDGWAHVSLIHGLGRWQIAGQFLRLVRGTHVRHPQVEHFTDRLMMVNAETPQAVALDGDLVGETPMRVVLLPGVLRVVAR